MIRKKKENLIFDYVTDSNAFHCFSKTSFFVAEEIKFKENLYHHVTEGLCSDCMDLIRYIWLPFLHRVRKKGATLFLPVTLRNANRFSKFFHRHTLQ